MRIILILLLLIPTKGYCQNQPYYSQSYNERYYGYGIPFAPIQTPRKWFPGQQPNHSHRFGVMPRYYGDTYFTYHYEIRF